MPSLEYDLAFLQAGIPELQGYLLSNELYWPLGLAAPVGERPYPRMTIGWLLFAQTRARGWLNADRTSSQLGMAEDLRRELEQIRERWRTAWEKKAAQEFGSRLKLLTNYINDYQGDKASHANQYTFEVQRRVILQLLAGETDQISQTELDLLKGIDSVLRAALKPGKFVWDQKVAGAFPQETYWYLYGSLPKK
jgi:hypothetical protein